MNLRWIILCSLSCFGYAFEHISLFTSTISIQNTGVLHVSETIEVVLAAGAHGLIREFPTDYKDSWGIKHHIRFAIDSLTLNGETAPYTITNFANGKKIQIGQADVVLNGGTYTYKINYTVDRQIGFFPEFDSLYWNVTGNGWKLPILQAKAVVYFPQAVSPGQLSFIAYTGAYGQKNNHYRAYWAHNALVFESTSFFIPGDGLTIAVKMPKGIVYPPTFITKVGYFMRDNGGIAWLSICLFLFLLFCFYRFLQYCKQQASGVIIPLFYPPQSLTPSQVRFIVTRGYDNTAFAADIINLAVHGYISIESKQYFFKRLYTLIKTDAGDPDFKSQAEPFISRIFKKSSRIDIVAMNASYIQSALDWLRNSLTATFSHYFSSDSNSIAYAVLGLFVVACGTLFFSVPEEIVYAALVVFGAIFILFCYGMQGYSAAGIQIRNQCLGFKMFLAATESERFSIIGTPPTKTPQLYEKYLPYAVALGVEKQWTDQFAPIFDQFAQAGHPYSPVWYHGSLDSLIRAAFISDFAQSLSTVSADAGNSNRTISSSSYVPGSSSGFDSNGHSGGGGGGGGGSSW